MGPLVLQLGVLPPQCMLWSRAIVGLMLPAAALLQLVMIQIGRKIRLPTLCCPMLPGLPQTSRCDVMLMLFTPLPPLLLAAGLCCSGCTAIVTCHCC
jgi:hypothetical protein